MENEKQKKPEEKTEELPPAFVTVPQAEMEKLHKELEECTDKYLRVLAESDNMRKRMQKERQELIQFAVQNAIVDFIEPIDHLEKALSYTQQTSEEVKNWAFGFQMILNQFKEVLTHLGVAPFKSQGTPFDPHHHEAVEMVVTTDYPPGTVIEESRTGYKMGERTIRPARVKVAKAPEPMSKTSSNGTEPNKEQKK